MDITSELLRKETSKMVREQSTSSRDFAESTKLNSLHHLEKELQELVKTCSNETTNYMSTQFKEFTKLFHRYLEEKESSIDWARIQKLPEKAIHNYNTLEAPLNSQIHKMLQQIVVVKLNGGLGTTMGCQGPKSTITVHSGLTFLDLTVQQIDHLNKLFSISIPLVLMNSFNTNEDTEKIIHKYRNLHVEIHTFNQSCYPRINTETLLPIPTTCNIKENIEAWYPPGHGDFYSSFYTSGLLNNFIKEGRQYCFVSNIDNLGATVDFNILNLLLNPLKSEHPEFVMEITDKTKADVKGGTLIYYENKLRLLEIAQVPKDHRDDFKSIKTFKYFNTNNIWIKLEAIVRVVENQLLNLEIIVNNKTMKNDSNIIQLETAIGAAMKYFDNAIGINVERSRFLPVKKTSDLLLIMSNLYTLHNGSLTLSEQRMFQTIPLIKLGDKYFGSVKDFLARFGTIPDILELDHLTVSGDVTFGRQVTLRGTVIIIANDKERIDIPSGAVLENNIITGHLNILDH